MSSPPSERLKTPGEGLEALLARQPRALARAISVLEAPGPEKQQLLRQLYSRVGGARVVGITGPPGAGKSTLVERLARCCRERDETVGILAVDPTSPFSGGALLGDRVRMQRLYVDPGVFIRSMATRGAMGGLARATRDAVDLLDATGFDWVLVETVGVGQDEVDVVRTVDTVVMVTVPGLGDEIQTIKAGIMEIADIFVINKCDRPGVESTLRDLESMLSMAKDLPWRPPIVKTIASQDQGIAELLERVNEHHAWLLEDDRLDERRFDQLRLRVETILKQRILSAAENAVGLEHQMRDSHRRGEDPYTVADRLFQRVLAQRSEEKR